MTHVGEEVAFGPIRRSGGIPAGAQRGLDFLLGPVLLGDVLERAREARNAAVGVLGVSDRAHPPVLALGGYERQRKIERRAEFDRAAHGLPDDRARPGGEEAHGLLERGPFGWVDLVNAVHLCGPVRRLRGDIEVPAADARHARDVLEQALAAAQLGFGGRGPIESGLQLLIGGARLRRCGPGEALCASRTLLPQTEDRYGPEGEDRQCPVRQGEPHQLGGLRGDEQSRDRQPGAKQAGQPGMCGVLRPQADQDNEDVSGADRVAERHQQVDAEYRDRESDDGTESNPFRAAISRCVLRHRRDRRRRCCTCSRVRSRAHELHGAREEHSEHEEPQHRSDQIEALEARADGVELGADRNVEEPHLSAAVGNRGMQGRRRRSIHLKPVHEGAGGGSRERSGALVEVVAGSRRFERTQAELRGAPGIGRQSGVDQKACRNPRFRRRSGRDTGVRGAVQVSNEEDAAEQVHAEEHQQHPLAREQQGQHFPRAKSLRDGVHDKFLGKISLARCNR